jgi:hypothetical protein
MKAKKSYKNGGKHPKGLKKSKDDNKKMIDMDRIRDSRFPKGLKKSDEDNKRMIDRDSVKKKKRKVVPFLSKKGSNRKMK